ncbi:MAG: hydroxyethylthiazole kinase [Ruminiclostridium sp.]|nr:hydroxyethylthiazole kinase [Ruminiclostridium sp.]
MIKNCAALLDTLREKNPLVHCITNYVTANTVANGLLAAGASPVMADSPLDAEDITAKASAVLFNMGTLSKDRLRAMLISAQKAADMAKPIVLDPVGAGSTDNRLRSTMQLLRQFRFSAIRGNASEISALLSTSPITMKAEKGVDSAETTLEDKIALAKKAAKRFSCTVMVTGSTDVVAGGDKVALVSNGIPMMSKITGTGCLASGLVAALCGCTEDSFEAAVTAASLIGMVGEIAGETAKGTGSLYVGMLDTLTNITPDIFEKYAKIENYTGEK